MKINIDELSGSVVPRLNFSITYLEQAANAMQGFDIPDYFVYKDSIRRMPSNIRNIKNDVSTVKTWVSDVVSKFHTAERQNENYANGIVSKIGDFNFYNNTEKNVSTITGNNKKSNNLSQINNKFLLQLWSKIAQSENSKSSINNSGTKTTTAWESITNEIVKKGKNLLEECKANVSEWFNSLLRLLGLLDDFSNEKVESALKPSCEYELLLTQAAISECKYESESTNFMDDPELQEGLERLNNILEIQNEELKSNAENVKNSIRSKTYNPYLENLLKKYCNTKDFEDLSEAYFMANTLKNLTEQLDLYIVDGKIPDPEIITGTDGSKKIQFAGLIFTNEDWNAIQHYLKSRGLTWLDLKEEFREAQDLLQTYYQDLLGRKNSIYSLERYIDLYPYTYITTKDDFNNYLERDYKDVNPEGEFYILAQEEKAIYFYLKEKYSEEEAKEYYNSLKDLINQRKGEIQALEYISTLDLTGLETIDGINNFLMTTGVGFEDGVWQFGENIVNLIPGQGEIKSELQYKQSYIIQMLTQEIDLEEIEKKYGKSSEEYKLNEKLSKMQSVYKEALGINYNVASSIGNEAIPIAVSFIPEVGSELGVALSALSAAGGAKAQAYQNGVTGWDAYLYAGIQGISSAVVTRYFAAIPGLSSNASTTIKGILKGATQARTFCSCTIKSRSNNIANIVK